MQSKRYRTSLLALLAGVMALLTYWILFEVPRTDFSPFILAMGGLFACYMGIIFNIHQSDAPANSLNWILTVGIGLRIIAWVALPELSDDYFRFIWDGQLFNHGTNPFLKVPSEYMQDPAAAAKLGLTQELYQGMNSPDYFTIYPPVLQGIFVIATALFPTSIYGAVLVMKAFILLAEIGSLFLLLGLLKKWGQDPLHLAWYALNPLVIVELCGNCHFEGVMIFFMLAAIGLLATGRIGWASVPFALAVCTKLIPLMTLPLLIRRLGWIKAIGFGALVGGITLLLFIPIFDYATLLHMLDSVELYFANFEFNASVWYVIKAMVADQFKENPLETIGPYLGLATVGLILGYTFGEKFEAGKDKQERATLAIASLPKAMMWVWWIYLMLASIVHPWYITTLVVLGTLTRFRFAMVWSALLPMTYIAYRTEAYEESLGIVAVEYAVVLATIMWEVLKPKVTLRSTTHSGG